MGTEGNGKVLGSFSEDEVRKVCADLDKSKARLNFIYYGRIQ